MRVEVQRRYLVWREETWTVIAPDVGTIQHMIDTHPKDFDEELLRFGELGDIAVIEIEDPVENQLHHDVDVGAHEPAQEVVFDYEEDQQDAQILQFRPREDT